jgi:hypothetical protein
MSQRTREVTVRKAASSEKIRWDYRAALDMAAETEEIFASQLALLADELERQGQPATADLLQQACHRHRASSMINRALALSLDG